MNVLLRCRRQGTADRKQTACRPAWVLAFALALAPFSFSAGAAHGQEPVSDVADQVNQKVVKLFGAGGFRGLEAYGTGVLVSPQGHILTVASTLLQTENLRVHLADGRRFENVKVLVVEPELDAALVQIENVSDLPYFDVAKAAQAAPAQPGDWVLAFSNEFEIATGDEPLSVQHGVVQAFARLQARKGVFDTPYTGDVYVLDAITNNPGAGGGALTTRKGELLGIIGKELRNTLTDTWVNYAVPIRVLAEFVEKAKKGEYKPVERKGPVAGDAGYHGIILIPKVVERTPPFVEEVMPNSPAARAGLRPDDLIVYLDGQQVPSIEAFQEVMTRVRAGTTVRLEVRRQARDGGADRLMTVELTLDPPLAKAPPKKP